MFFNHLLFLVQFCQFLSDWAIGVQVELELGRTIVLHVHVHHEIIHFTIP